MVERFFLALDYETTKDAHTHGSSTLFGLCTRYGPKFVDRYFGVKINEDLLMGAIDPDLKRFKTIFADKKISHGADTGSRILKRLAEDLGPRYVTVSANLGHSILRKYVEEARKYGMDIIAWTVHTKTSPEDAQKMYKRPLNDVILNLAEMAWGAGCHAVVLEAGMLEDERIRELPIKKLVTGIRIDPSDKGSQKRVSSLEEVAKMKEAINYAVISSRYLEDIEATTQIVEALKPREV